MTKALVGLSTCGIAAGAADVYTNLVEQVKTRKLNLTVEKTGCIGMCYKEPLVEILSEDGYRYLYGKVDDKKLERILEDHVQNNKPVDEWLVWVKQQDDSVASEQNFLDKQVRIVLRNCGVINPESIDDYIARDGYKGIEKALKTLSPDEIIELLIESGLRGRGGAGFPTGMKWRLTKMAPGNRKFLVCNADEGDPGAFMDRSVLEGDPHSLIEGMLIAGYAIGANEGYIYVRAEYPKAIERLNIALEQAKERGFIGESICDSDFAFHLKIKEGAGAFVCGEETALIASIEGKRGMPHVRPPFPATKGLWDCPTNNNNVETYANVPFIVFNGPPAYNQYGTARSKGTKVFALAGKVKRGGLVEVPMGITIRSIVFDICGGIRDDKNLKAVQMGGPSGGCIPAELMDTIIDYDNITKTGAIMGSGGLIVMDETTCMVDVARYFLNFTQMESCGKCTFCRIGTKRMLEILTRITEGKGEEGDIQKLEELSHRIKTTSLCGLGQSAPNPVLTTLKYFRSEYESHILNKKCPAHSCQALLTFDIIAEKCTGCGACVRACPVNAISGERKQVHVLDQEKCTQCGACYDTCRFDAIMKD
jgi:NADH-quinone oxidoreductase subunit F